MVGWCRPVFIQPFCFPFRQKRLEINLDFVRFLFLYCRNYDLIDPGKSLLVCTDQLCPDFRCSKAFCFFFHPCSHPAADSLIFTDRTLYPDTVSVFNQRINLFFQYFLKRLYFPRKLIDLFICFLSCFIIFKSNICKQCLLIFTKFRRTVYRAAAALFLLQHLKRRDLSIPIPQNRVIAHIHQNITECFPSACSRKILTNQRRKLLQLFPSSSEVNLHNPIGLFHRHFRLVCFFQNDGISAVTFFCRDAAFIPRCLHTETESNVAGCNHHGCIRVFRQLNFHIESVRKKIIIFILQKRSFSKYCFQSFFLSEIQVKHWFRMPFCRFIAIRDFRL